MTINNHDNFRLFLTNARSLGPKIQSLQNNFEMHDIDVAFVTESWLKDGKTLENDVIDLEHGTDLKIIYRNRPKKPTRSRVVGGGVSLVYSKLRCSLRERKIAGNNFELVSAIGRIGKIPRQAAFFCLYVEPKMKVGELRNLTDLLHSQILQLKAKGDPMIFIAGDLNCKDLSDAFEDFTDIKQINFDPTRRGACLDIMFSNVDMGSSTWPPLQSHNGALSDHDCVLFTGSVRRERNFKWITRITRKHTEKAMEMFGRELDEMNWDELLNNNADPDDLVAAFETRMEEMTDRLFPKQSIRCRDTDPPWVTNGVRRMSRKKKRVWKREGKSRLWCTLRDCLELMIEGSRTDFVQKVLTGGHNSSAFHSAVKSLSCKEKPPQWNLMDLFPGRTEEEAGEETSTFFTAITDTFTPLLPEPSAPPEALRRRPVTVDQVREKLRAAKKPNSSVKGDVLPRVMKRYYSKFAIPATKIYNAIFRSASWPSAWKEETTVVIPKVPVPGSLAECRNISCTPFLSKVLESILLEDLRRELTPDPTQYGGLKNCSVNHLLVDLFDRVLGSLDQGNPVVLLGIDYEKAFNRLDHKECLRQLKKLGASPQSTELVRSFLTGRCMRVKIGQSLSAARGLKGGSPQGSILGCLLYCLATQQLNNSLPPKRRMEADGEAVRPADTHQDPTTSPAQEGDDLDVLQWAAPPSAAIPSPTRGTLPDTVPELRPDLERREEGSITMQKYIDDTTLIETVDAERCTRHLTTGPAVEWVPADLTGDLLERIVERAEDIGMRVNCKKTQMLVMGTDNGCKSNSAISVGGVEIASGCGMMLLGFMIGVAGMDSQVDYLKKRFRARFWALIHLRRSGIKGDLLFRLFATLVRPILEANAVVYHPMCTKAQNEELERLQKRVLRLCYGTDINYGATLASKNIATLEQRRADAVKKFVGKILAAETPFKDKWFKRRQTVETQLRNRRPYVEIKARTERYYRSPLLYLQRTANDIATGA